MRLRYVSASLLAAVALMVVGVVFWAGLADRFGAMKGLPGAEKAVPILKKTVPSSGTYLYPMPSHEKGKKDAEKRFIEQHKKGPLMMVFFRKDGFDPMQPIVFLKGFLHNLFSALLLGLLLLLAMPNLQSFARRYGFVVIAGLFASVWIEWSGPIWFHHPTDFHTFNFVYQIVGWIVAGLPMAWLLRPKNEVGA